jgi:anti-sigma B factor antagonist
MAENRYPMEGEIALATTPKLRLDLKRAIAAGGDHFVVDCAQLEFIDSSGIAALLEVNTLLEADGRHLVIVNVPRGPRRVFEALGLTDLLRDERDSA